MQRNSVFQFRIRLRAMECFLANWFISFSPLMKFNIVIYTHVVKVIHWKSLKLTRKDEL